MTFLRLKTFGVIVSSGIFILVLFMCTLNWLSFNNYYLLDMCKIWLTVIPRPVLLMELEELKSDRIHSNDTE